MTAESKTAYIGKLDDIFDKYKTTHHKTIKMKPIDVKTSTILTLMLKLVIKMLRLKGNNDVRMTELVEIFLLKFALQIGQKKILLLKKSKIPSSGGMLLVISTVKTLFERFIKRIRFN